MPAKSPTNLSRNDRGGAGTVRRWARYLACGLAGAVLGIGASLYSVRAGAFGSSARIGPWATGTDFGTADAGAYTRAVVALRGLLALPAREARYYTAAEDDAGRPLEGRCAYRIKGGEAGGAWWSLTLYGRDGFLVANPANIWSVGSAALPPDERQSWTVTASPGRRPGRWLPTGGIDRFELTLRVYLPEDRGRSNLPRERLPRIERLDCA
jgi:hypothetical protein